MRNILRHAKAHAIRFRKAHRPIILLALRRGGSTMVSDAIANCQGVWFSNEPFAVLPRHPAYDLKQNLLPRAEHSQFFCLEGRDIEKFASYSLKLLNAELRQIGRCWKAKPLLVADRTCLKILNAPWMIEWFQQNTDAHVLTLIRHPGSQALSVLRQGWGHPVEAYARRNEELEEYFTSAQIDLLTSILREGNSWKTAILDWIITSYPLRRLGDKSTLRETYENIVSDPESFIQRTLMSEFGLKDEATMRETFLRPSHSSRMSEASLASMVAERDVDKLINGWRSKVDDDMCIDGQRLLDAFEVSEYSFTK